MNKMESCLTHRRYIVFVHGKLNFRCIDRRKCLYMFYFATTYMIPKQVTPCIVHAHSMSFNENHSNYVSTTKALSKGRKRCF